MLQLSGETFWCDGEPRDIFSVSVQDSEFNNCVIRSKVSDWNRLSEIRLTDVSHMNCALSGCVFEDVSLHNLKKTGSAPLFIWASVFKHTRLTGRISGLKINRSDLSLLDEATRDKRELATKKHYESVDWALDISDAKFPNGVTFEAIPGDKIVRDPSTQILVKRASLVGRDWRSLDFDRSAIDIAISWFEDGSMFDSVVIVSRSDSKYRAMDQKILEMLRREGIAEPD